MEDLIILHEDNHIIVVLKPQNIPSCEDSSKDKDLLTMIKEYIKVTYDKPGTDTGEPKAFSSVYEAEMAYDQGIIALQHSRCGADNGCQRCPDIMGYRSQQIGSHFLVFAVRTQTLLTTQLVCQCTGTEGNQQHREKGQWISGQRKVQRQIGICKHIVYAYHADQ